MRLACTLLATATLAESLSLRANTATEPTALGESWMTKHDEFVQAARKGGIDLLSLGDSIVEYWLKDTVKDIPRGRKVWDSEYVPLHAAGFGISGDRTQHLLWRIENGELEGIHPKVIVLMIGFYHGAILSDPTGLLEGTGKKLRHVKIRSSEAAGSATITRLVKAAVRIV